MKVLAVVDVHKNDHALEKTLEYIKLHHPDLLIIAGDITTFGPLEFAREFLENLPELRTVAIPGNCDPRAILQVLDDSRAINLHGRKETIEGITFVGLGGSNITPFNTPFELTEAEIYQELDKIMEPGAVLVLHFPVRGYLDEVPRGEHTGSTSAQKIVEKYRPSLGLSGHIHETRGIKTDENGTIYVNPGPLQNGYAALLEISPAADSKVAVKRYDCKVTLL